MSQVKIYIREGKVEEHLQGESLLLVPHPGETFVTVDSSDMSKIREIFPDVNEFGEEVAVVDGTFTIHPNSYSGPVRVRSALAEVAREEKIFLSFIWRELEFIERASKEKGEYRIHIGCLPEEFREYQPLRNVERAFNVQDLEGTYNVLGFSSSDIHQALADMGDQEFTAIQDANGEILALVKPFEAWLPWMDRRLGEDLPEGEFYRFLVSTMMDQVEDMDEYMASLKRKEREELLERWGKLLSGRHDVKVQKTQEKLEAAEDQLTEKRQEVTSLLKKIPNLKKVLSLVEEFKPDTEALAKELENLQSNPWSRDIKVDEVGETLTIETATIVMDGDEDIISEDEETLSRWAGMMVPIGKFKITMHTSGNIEIVNITNPKDKESASRPRWHHPHIPATGSPCFGTIERALPQLIAEYAFAEAFQLLVQFLSCCNADDSWGMNIGLWYEDAYPKGSPKDLREQEATPAEAA